MPLKTEKTVYYPGERVNVVVNFCKKLEYAGKIRHQLFLYYNNQIEGSNPIASAEAFLQPYSGCQFIKDGLLTIPTNVVPGKYYIAITVIYEISNEKNLSKLFRTDSFLIKK